MNKDKAFRKIIDILSKADCKWWLDAGTCLAVVRNGDFIAETDDVDIGIDVGENHPPWDFLMKDFQEAGWGLAKIRTYKQLFMTIGFTGPEKVDIFFYHKKGEYLWHTICGWEDERQKRKVYKPEKFPEALFMTLKEVQFKDRTVFLPNPPEMYLVHRYGRDWSTPNPDYKFWRDSQAIDMEFA